MPPLPLIALKWSMMFPSSDEAAHMLYAVAFLRYYFYALLMLFIYAILPLSRYTLYTIRDMFCQALSSAQS